MTNFRYSQNPRVARKRPSRTSRVAARRRFSDNRYRERSEIHRSARRNKRANLTLTPSDITWVAREREPGFFWVEGTDSEGYHYKQGLVPASSAREAIEEMESGYQFSLRRGNRTRRANRVGDYRRSAPRRSRYASYRKVAQERNRETQTVISILFDDDQRDPTVHNFGTAENLRRHIQRHPDNPLSPSEMNRVNWWEALEFANDNDTYITMYDNPSF